MVFSDLFFIFAFIPSFALLYILASLIDKKMKTSPDTPYNRTKNWVLVLFSLLFYAWGEPVYVFLMLFSVLVNFIAGRVIDRSDRHRKMALVIGLICNILILGVFKYLGFFGSILADLGISVALPTLALPIGISFYTFQSISYLIDVYRRESPAQKRYADLLLYISMFPQLIAGPIVRYDTVATEITDRHVTANDVADGAFRFLVGLGKKVIIANQLSEVADQFLVGGIGNLSTTGAWVGILAFTLQIYFDFSGYSDMAIGIGRCLGFHFKENFNHPYCCNSITDFWRRWHMSLGSFFRDYVYIPLGGNRRHQAWNIFVVWFLTGMWHGASWNFIIWGVYFGFIVAVEKYTILRLKNRMFTPLLHLYSLIL
ncbi:MAG: MBOAT family protein, partial [Prevotella sp.]|nr:MBOAT family protein [Prevotella sp.]